MLKLGLYNGDLACSQSMAELAIRRKTSQNYVAQHMTTAPTFVTTACNEKGAPKEVTWRGCAFRVEVSLYGFYLDYKISHVVMFDMTHTGTFTHHCL